MISTVDEYGRAAKLDQQVVNAPGLIALSVVVILFNAAAVLRVRKGSSPAEKSSAGTVSKSSSVGTPRSCLSRSETANGS